MSKRSRKTGGIVAVALFAGAALLGGQNLPGTTPDLISDALPPVDSFDPGSAEVEQSSAPDPSDPFPVSPEEVTTAWAELSLLEVKGRAPKTGYSRSEFGQRWSDDVDVEFGRDGCDTRNNILDRDLYNVTYRPGTNDCVVLSGTLHDPYTDTIIEFQRGEDTSNDVQIDHVVSLSDAWQKGAQQLPEDVRRNFANDPINLLAVDGSANMSKGDGDAATWLPPNRGFRCNLAVTQIRVKHTYGLWVTAAERDALAQQLETC